MQCPSAEGKTSTVGMLEGKSALVTGGGGGIGRAAALAVADLVAEAAEETVALVNRAGGQAMSLTGDITNGGLVQDMIGSVVAAYGSLDCAFIMLASHLGRWEPVG